MPATPTWIERLLGHQRTALAVVVVGIPAFAWIWVVALARDMYGPMTGASAWMMTTTWDLPHVVLLWAMWAAMMAGMMLPSATPLLLLYGRAARSRDAAHTAAIRVYSLAGGYLLVWAGFSVLATVLQRVLATRFLTPMMEPATSEVGAVVLVVAGMYQFAPVKLACLRACRSPIASLARHWRPGVGGALWMGLLHGTYCLGCCWALMLLLFAGGVMNLAVILALTAWVIAEKAMPYGEQGARVAGVLLLLTAAWMVAR